MKSPVIAPKKFNFNWNNISPSGFTFEGAVADLYNNKVICGYKDGVAVNVLSQPGNHWKFFTETDDGIPVKNITSVSVVDDNISVFSDGNGYFIFDGDTIVKRTAANSLLPGDNVSRVKVSASEESRILQEFFVCTDKGLYINLYIAESSGGVGESSEYIYTTDNGLPGNNVLDVAGNRNILVVVTDKGAAFSVDDDYPPSKFIHREIDIIDNDKLLFVDVDYKSKAEQADASDNIIVIASSNKVALSNDGGLIWTDITPPNFSQCNIHCVHTFDNGIYIGTDSGLFISGNGGKVWRKYTRDDGLSGDNVTSISFDYDAEAIIVSASDGINQGEYFRWTVSTIKEAGTVYCIAESFDYQRKHVVFFAGTDKGLFQSMDGCQTWENVYDRKTVYTVQANNFLENLCVGTDGDGILVYDRPFLGIKNKSPRIIDKSNGLLSNEIYAIALDASSAFGRKAFVAYDTFPGLSYTNDIYDDSKDAWKKFDESNNITDSKYFTLRVLDDKLFCSAPPGLLNQKGASLVVTDKIEIGVDCKYLKFSLSLSYDGLGSVGDMFYTGDKFFVSSFDKDELGGYDYGDIRVSTDLKNWIPLDMHAFWGKGGMAGTNNELYVYDLDSLICYSTNNDTQLAYPLPKGDSESYGQRPLIAGEKIYLPTSNGRIFISELSKVV